MNNKINGVYYYISINKNIRQNNKRALELLLDEKIDDIEIIELSNIDYSKLSREENFNMF